MTADQLFEQAQLAANRGRYELALDLYENVMNNYDLNMRGIEYCQAAIDALPIISDGLGNYSPRYCRKCGGEMIVIRPGDIRCSKCEN